MNDNILNNSNSNISNSSSHLAQLNHQLNNLQVTNQNLQSSFQQQQQTTNGPIAHHHQQLIYHNAQVKHSRETVENLLEGDLILQALYGFLFIITCDGTVFYISHTVETYLGYPQSDVCHQSVYDLVHSEDREELQRHLMWNHALPADKSNMTLSEALQPDKPPGFAFVDFEDYRDAAYAVRELDGTRIGGVRVRVELSHGKTTVKKPKDRSRRSHKDSSSRHQRRRHRHRSRTRSRSSSRSSRSYSRSRSHSRDRSKRYYSRSRSR